MNPEAVSRFISDLQPAYETADPLAADKQLEQENLGGVRGLYEALLQQDGAALAQLLAEDVELEIAGPKNFPMVGRWKGRDNVLQAAAVNFSKLEDQRPEILSLVAQGEQVAVVAREQGRIKGTEATYDIRWLQLYSFRDKQIAAILQFCDDPQAFIPAA